MVISFGKSGCYGCGTCSNLAGVAMLRFAPSEYFIRMDIFHDKMR
jgi:hypothetical protein